MWSVGFIQLGAQAYNEAWDLMGRAWKTDEGAVIKILVLFPEKHAKNKGRYKQLLKMEDTC